MRPKTKLPKVVVIRNSNGDTRSADKIPSFEEFQKANDMHIRDVSTVMNNIGNEIIKRGDIHDWTKKEKEDLFYREFIETLKDGKKFTDGEWFNYHINTERHHLTRKPVEDINLIDVLEYISDCYCAGKARSGNVYPLTISDSDLRKAFENTCKLVDESISINDKKINPEG